MMRKLELQRREPELREILADPIDNPLAYTQRAAAFLLLMEARGTLDRIHAE